jgi:hypothetical protein
MRAVAISTQQPFLSMGTFFALLSKQAAIMRKRYSMQKQRKMSL